MLFRSHTHTHTPFQCVTHNTHNQQTTKPSHHQTIKPSHHQTTKQSNHLTTKPTNYQTITPPNYQTTKLSNYHTSTLAHYHPMISTKQTTLSLFALALLLLACDNNTASSKLGTLENVVNTPNTIHNTKIAIDFQQNKVLLDILLLLPDSAFDSWEWELSDRQRWYNEIKENNAYTDENPEFLNNIS